MSNRKHMCALLGVGLVAALVMLSVPAVAQPGDDEMSKTVVELYSAAEAARDQKNYPACHAKAKAAWALQKHPKIAAVYGDCAMDVGQPREAAEHLAFYLAHRSPNANAELVAYMEKRFTEAKTKIGTVRVTVNVAEASVRFDDVTAKGELTFYADPGLHKIAAAHEGYKPVEQQVEVAAGQELDVALVLELLIAGNGDGVPPPPSTDGYYWAVGAGAALTAIGLGVGIGLTVAANGTASDRDILLEQVSAAYPAGCNDSIAQCTELVGLNEDKDLLHNAAVGVWIGTGVSALALTLGAILAYPDSSTSVTLVPTIGPDHAGFSATVSF